MTPASPPLDSAAPTPQMFGRYRVVRELGRGGQGETFLVEHSQALSAERTFVARACLKRLFPSVETDPTLLGAFIDEACLTAELHHPQVVGAFDAGRCPDGSLYLVTRYVEGCSLRDLEQLYSKDAKTEETPYAFPISFALCIASQLAEALRYLHDFHHDGHPLNIVHRDVKPANIMLDRGGNAQLIDFGTARALNNAHRTREGDIRGSLRYMSPEQINNRPLDRRSDLWSLGVVMYEMLTGLSPFRSKPEQAVGEVIANILRAQLPPLREVRPEVPEALAWLVHELLRPDPAERLADADQLLARLDAFELPAAMATSLGLRVSETMFALEEDDDEQHSATRAAPTRRTSLTTNRPPVLPDSPGESSPASAASSIARPGDEATGRTSAIRRGGRTLPMIALAAIAIVGAGLTHWMTQPALPESEAPLPFLASTSLEQPAGQKAATGEAKSIRTADSEPPSARKPPVVEEVPAAEATFDEMAAENPSPPLVSNPSETNAPSPAKPATRSQEPLATSARAQRSPPASSRRKRARDRATLDIFVHDWAYVWLDRKLLGMSPRLGLQLKPGPHEVELSQDMARTGAVAKTTIQVQPGENKKHFHFGDPLL